MHNPKTIELTPYSGSYIIAVFIADGCSESVFSELLGTQVHRQSESLRHVSIEVLVQAAFCPAGHCVPMSGSIVHVFHAGINGIVLHQHLGGRVG